MTSEINPSKQKEELEDRLVREHYGLVVSQALSFLDDDSVIEDYIQVGLIGLLKAVRKYDQNKAKFSTFASVCIKNEILLLKKKEKNRKKVKLFYNNNLMRSASKHFIDKESFFEIEPDYLTSEQKFILKLKLSNFTNSEISEYLSCSKEQLNNKIRDIIETLRDANI